MQQNRVELDFLEMVEIDQAANIMGTSVKALLKEAAACQRLLYVALAPHQATLVAIPSHHAPLHAKRSPGGTIFVALYAPYCVELALRGSVEIKHWHASTEDEGPLAWHYWHLDKPQVVGLDMVFVPELDLAMRAASQAHPNASSSQHGADSMAMRDGAAIKKSRHKWDGHDLRKLHEEYNAVGFNSLKLAAQYGISRQALEKQIKKAVELCRAGRKPTATSKAWKGGN